MQEAAINPGFSCSPALKINISVWCVRGGRRPYWLWKRLAVAGYQSPKNAAGSGFLLKTCILVAMVFFLYTEILLLLLIVKIS